MLSSVAQCGPEIPSIPCPTHNSHAVAEAEDEDWRAHGASVTTPMSEGMDV